jgi:hypothetical protein
VSGELGFPEQLLRRRDLDADEQRPSPHVTRR